MEDLNRKRTRSTTGTGTSSGLNKYNDLLRTTTTQEEEEEEPQQNVKVRVRGSTNLFVDALEPLGPERRKMLENTPFHKLLVMDRNIQNNGIIKKLATIFNTQDHSIELKGERHVVTAQDVTEIMGIEDGEEEEIKLPRRGQKAHVPPQLKKDFVKRGQKEICMEKVKTKLRESLDEDTVKRAYMLLVLRYIVYPPSAHDYLPESCLDLVRDVNKKKRWATFVITSLVNGIEKYNNYKGNKEIFIGGCALFLQLYATKGSITTPPLECDKRQKTRDKEGTDLFKNARLLKNIMQQRNESMVTALQKKQKKHLSKVKNKMVKDFLKKDGEDVMVEFTSMLDAKMAIIDSILECGARIEEEGISQKRKAENELEKDPVEGKHKKTVGKVIEPKHAMQTRSRRTRKPVGD